MGRRADVTTTEGAGGRVRRKGGSREARGGADVTSLAGKGGGRARRGEGVGTQRKRGCGQSGRNLNGGAEEGSRRRSFEERLHREHENEGANGVVLSGKGRRRAWEPRGEGEEEGIRLGWEGRPG